MEVFTRADNDSSNVQGSDHDHVEVTSFPGALDTEPGIFFVDFFPFDEGFLTDTVKGTFNGSGMFDSEFRWSVESVVVSGGEVKDDLVEFVVGVLFEFFDFFFSVSDFLALNEISERVRGSLDDGAFVFGDL